MNNKDLLNYRTRLELSVSDMSRFLAVPKATYIKWENGSRSLTSASVRLIQLMQTIELMAPAIFNAMLHDITGTK